MTIPYFSYESSEGLILCSGGRDGTVKLWKLAPIPEPDQHAEHDKQSFHGRSFSSTDGKELKSC